MTNSASGTQIGLGQLQGRLFQLETVDEDQVGIGQALGIGRRRLEGVGIDAFGHDAHHLCLVPRDIVDQVGDRRDGGDDAQLAGVCRWWGRWRRGAGSQRQAGRPIRTGSIQDLIVARMNAVLHVAATAARHSAHGARNLAHLVPLIALYQECARSAIVAQLQSSASAKSYIAANSRNSHRGNGRSGLT